MNFLASLFGRLHRNNCTKHLAFTTTLIQILDTLGLKTAISSRGDGQNRNPVCQRLNILYHLLLVPVQFFQGSLCVICFLTSCSCSAAWSLYPSSMSCLVLLALLLIEHSITSLTSQTWTLRFHSWFHLQKRAQKSEFESCFFFLHERKTHCWVTFYNGAKLIDDSLFSAEAVKWPPCTPTVSWHVYKELADLHASFVHDKADPSQLFEDSSLFAQQQIIGSASLAGKCRWWETILFYWNNSRENYALNLTTGLRASSLSRCSRNVREAIKSPRARPDSSWITMRSRTQSVWLGLKQWGRRRKSSCGCLICLECSTHMYTDY